VAVDAELAHHHGDLRVIPATRYQSFRSVGNGVTAARASSTTGLGCLVLEHFRDLYRLITVRGEANRSGTITFFLSGGRNAIARQATVSEIADPNKSVHSAIALSVS